MVFPLGQTIFSNLFANQTVPPPPPPMFGAPPPPPPPPPMYGGPQPMQDAPLTTTGPSLQDLLAGKKLKTVQPSEKKEKNVEQEAIKQALAGLKKVGEQKTKTAEEIEEENREKEKKENS